MARTPSKRIAKLGSKFVYVTYIRVTPEKLWHALTTPEIIGRYRFGMSVESEWKVGSTWRMYADGSLMDSGEILESVPQKRLVMSWQNNWRPEFKAEGKSRCAYEIEPVGASAKLTLTHSIERPNSKFIGAVSDGWPMVISNLKSLLETGDVALVYHRHGTKRRET
ncbi:MAG TPA: SRPBCC family protein [Burkholderiales bacterium]